MLGDDDAGWLDAIQDRKTLLFEFGGCDTLHTPIVISDSFYVQSKFISILNTGRESREGFPVTNPEFSLALGLAGVINKSSLDSATETDAGDLATLDLHKGIGPLKLFKSDGVWKIDPGILPKLNIEWQHRFHDCNLPTLSQMALDVRDGKYSTPEELKADVARLHKELSADYRRFFLPRNSAPAEAQTNR